MQCKVALLPECFLRGGNKKFWKMLSQIFCYINMRNHSLQRCSVKLFFFFLTFFLAGMPITLAWRRWCRCSVKWFWSSHCSSWMQTWTPRTISQHYFLWVLLHLTLLGVFLLVCRSLNSWSSSWLRTLCLSLKWLELLEVMSLFFFPKSELKLLFLLDRNQLRP